MNRYNEETDCDFCEVKIKFLNINFIDSILFVVN
jgi:hypothetical protein